MERLGDLMMFGIAICFAILGIIGIVCFFMTLKWHCIMLSAMSITVLWVWYQEDYKSKGKKISTLWQKKNTKN